VDTLAPFCDSNKWRHALIQSNFEIECQRWRGFLSRSLNYIAQAGEMATLYMDVQSPLLFPQVTLLTLKNIPYFTLRLIHISGNPSSYQVKPYPIEFELLFLPFLFLLNRGSIAGAATCKSRVRIRGHRLVSLALHKFFLWKVFP